MKTFIKYSPSLLIPIIINLVLIIIYGRYMNSEDYGVYSLIVITVNILTLIFSGFISNSMIRLYDDYKIKEEENAFLATSLKFFLLFSPIFMFIIYISNYEYKYYLLVATLGFSINNIITAYYRVSNEALNYNLFKIAPVFLQLIIVIVLVFSKDISFQNVTIAHYLPLLVFSIVGLIPLYIKTNVRFETEILKNSFTYSFPLVIVSLLNIVTSSSDRFIISYFSNNHDLGLYSFSYKITELVMVTLVNFIMIALYPMLIKVYNEFGIRKSSELLSKYFYFQLLVSLPILIIIILYSNYYLNILFPEYLEASLLFKVLSIGTLIFSLTFYFNKSFEIGKNVKVILFILLQTSLLNVIMNIILIPYFGVIGAAYATIISYIYYLIVCILKSKKLVRVLFNKRILIILVGVISISMLAILPSYWYLKDNINLPLINTLLFLFYYSILVLLLRKRIKKSLNFND